MMGSTLSFYGFKYDHIKIKPSFIKFMLNNSLKQSNNCSSITQTRISHKMAKYTSLNTSVEAGRKHVIRFTNDSVQHSELNWLENVVHDMKSYKFEEIERFPMAEINRPIVNSTVKRIEN